MYDQVVTSLPAYACPRFLRIQVILKLQTLLLNVRTRTKRWLSRKILLSRLDNVWILFILVNFKNKKQKDTELMLSSAVLGVVGEGSKVKCCLSVLPMELFSSSARISGPSDALSEVASQNCTLHISSEDSWSYLPKIRFGRVNIKMVAECKQNLEQFIFKQVSSRPFV